MDKELAKLLAQLTALKNNIPKDLVPRKYADEFNTIISELAQISADNLDDFLVPPSEIKPRVTSFSYVTGQKDYSTESYCQREYLLMKIDGVLGYFTLLLQPAEVKDQMGFRVGKNE